MVLVDTSVWVRFLADQPPYAAGLDQLLERDEVAGHDFVYGELTIGDPGARKELLISYRLLQKLSPVTHAEVLDLVLSRKMHGRGIGWIDAHLLASALVSNVRLWTADKPLGNLAAEFGVGYKPSAG